MTGFEGLSKHTAVRHSSVRPEAKALSFGMGTRRKSPEEDIISGPFEGKLTSYNGERGFGFIHFNNENDEPEDIFVHISVLQAAGFEAEDLYENLPLSLYKGNGRGGKLAAVKVEKLEEVPVSDEDESDD